MREMLKDWRDEWIQTNGVTDALEVVISDSTLDGSASYVYEGSFAQMPDGLLLRKVIQCNRIVASSIKERNGAYALTI